MFSLLFALYLSYLPHSIIAFLNGIGIRTLVSSLPTSNKDNVFNNPLIENHSVSQSYYLSSLNESIIYFQVKEEKTDTFINIAIEDESIEPFGIVPWNASFVAVDILNSQYYKNINNKLDKNLGIVIDLACGVGLSSIAALALGAKHVHAVDLNPDSLHLVKKAAQLQGYEDRLTTQEFDIEKYDNILPKCDLLILSDILYYPSLAKAAAVHCARAIKQGSRVLITDPGRSTQTDFIYALKDRIQLMQLQLTRSDSDGDGDNLGQGIEESLVIFKEHEVKLDDGKNSSICKGYYMLV